MIQPVTKETTIQPGDSLFDDNPLLGRREVKVLRVTNTMIEIANGVRYSRHGYLVGDKWKRQRLYKA